MPEWQTSVCGERLRVLMVTLRWQVDKVLPECPVNPSELSCLQCAGV